MTMTMLGRLRYLYEEGFEVSSVMGYDAEKESEKGEGSILYRVQEPDGKWRVMQETFQVSYDEMMSCSSLFLRRLNG